MIRIGADELILWMRKNGIAPHIPNDEIQGLGRRIYDIIVALGGAKVVDNHPAKWPVDSTEVDENGDLKIDKYNLPKTAAQYDLPDNLLPRLYNELRAIK